MHKNDEGAAVNQMFNEIALGAAAEAARQDRFLEHAGGREPDT